MSAQQPSPTATAYAKALLELANDRGQAEAVGAEMASILAVLDQTPAFRQYLADPGIGTEEKKAMLDKLFRGRASATVYNFLGVMNERGKLALLPEAANAYEDLLAEQAGVIEVDVTVPQRLSADELEQVRASVGRQLGKNVVIHQYVDASLIGGLTLRIGDKLIDASVKRQLEVLRDRMLAAAPR